MGKLIIKRNNSLLAIARKAGVFIDGKKIGLVANDETAHFELKNGDYILKVGFGILSGFSNKLPVSINKEPIYISFKASKLWLVLYVVAVFTGIYTATNNFKYWPIALIIVIILSIFQAKYLFKIEQVSEL